ncbi:hypothetical protein H5410_023130 [Solanum commersonii]|uniref:X8 domain-containing protein n=2 Tax=Solanum commersonii TaxID=4109 RepID=A0A9J5ZFZ7_SOLCO|nr:hypothetical protein H5410_023130 [Solanum commersonii]
MMENLNFQWILQDKDMRQCLLVQKMLKYLENKWCVLNKYAEDIGKLPSSVQYACSRSDCTAVDYGGSCNKLDGDGNVSYAFNMYFQMNGQDVESCIFDGLAQIVEKDASVDNCLFPIGLESVGVRIGLDAILNTLVGFFLFLTLLKNKIIKFAFQCHVLDICFV